MARHKRIQKIFLLEWELYNIYYKHLIPKISHTGVQKVHNGGFLSNDAS
jgi:hypothetical protein